MKVFISYRRRTWPFTHRLADNLRERIDGEVFVDVDSIDEELFERSILRHLRESDVFLLIVSPETFAPERIQREGDWVRREVREALEGDKSIVLACVEGLTPPGDLPDDIRAIADRQGIRFYADYFDAGVDKLVGFIDRVEAARRQRQEEAERQRRQAQQARVKELQRELAALDADTTVSPKAKLDDAIAELEARLEVERARRAAPAEPQPVVKEVGGKLERVQQAVREAGADDDADVRKSTRRLLRTLELDVMNLPDKPIEIAPPLSLEQLQAMTGFTDEELALNRTGKATRSQQRRRRQEEPTLTLFWISLILALPPTLYQAYRAIFHSTGWLYFAQFGLVEDILHVLAAILVGLFWFGVLGSIPPLLPKRVQSHSAQWLLFAPSKEEFYSPTVRVGDNTYWVRSEKESVASNAPTHPVAGYYTVYHFSYSDFLSIEPAEKEAVDDDLYDLLDDSPVEIGLPDG